MNIIPFVHEGLGNSSYLVGLDDNTALLVDPDRSIERYLRTARDRGWRITAMFETHLHADFVTGAHELAAAVGAKLFLPQDAQSRLAHEPVRNADRFTMSGMEIEAVGSPGHTPEHISYVARGAAGPPVLFSGGSMIVGGAARTDLIAPDMTDTLTRAQYHTLHSAFGALPDDTALYPTHGGGSFCSAGGGDMRASTLGVERGMNPALAVTGEDEFATWFPTTFPAAPAYYFRMRAFNQRGPRLRRDVTPPPSLSPSEFAARQHDATVIDVRPVDAYARLHIPGAISIPFRDAFAVWLGWLVEEQAKLLFVTNGMPLERVLDESLLVGYERFAGVLEGGMRAWEQAGLPLARTDLIDADGARWALRGGAAVIDVREPDEFRSGHIPGAIHIPLGDLAQRIDEVPADGPVLAYCGHGERAATAISLLERSGRHTLLNLNGGIAAWRAAGNKTVA